MLSNQRILVTGANGGIGKAICEALLQNNANLVLFYHDKKDGIDDLLEKYGHLQNHIQTHHVDLLESTNLETTLRTVLEHGKIDSFIHSVTVPTENKDILQMSWSDFQSHIDLQTKSYLQILQAIIPSMKELKHGKIVSILTSYTVGSPPNRLSDYVTAKYSLFGLSKALAVELGPYGITVNCVSPSMTDTPLIENLPSKLKEINASQTPLRRLASPLDVASVVMFLCSKGSAFINGENILVSGGQTMH